jgi:hypothetical protein
MVDYTETYASVMHKSSLRYLLALAARRRWHAHSWDIETAFLNAELQDRIYMEIPEGIDALPDSVFLLKRSIYGLKQSPRLWMMELRSSLEEIGFRRTIDHSIYVKDNAIVGVYVDDIICMSDSTERIQEVLKALQKKYSLSDQGQLDKYLGMEFRRQKDGILLHQKRYIDGVTKKLLVNSKSERRKRRRMYGLQTRSPPNVNHLEEFEQGPRVSKEVYSRYRTVIGTVLFIAACCRPDIAYTVLVLGRYQQRERLRQKHVQKAEELLEYLADTADLGLLYCYGDRKDDEDVVVQTDATWGSDIDTRKSQSGVLVYYNGCLVQWCSQKQKCIALSSAESEIVAMTLGVTEGQWIRRLMEELESKLGGMRVESCPVWKNQTYLH